MSRRARADERAIYKLVSAFGCTAAYVDVGTNIGVQIRKLFEPHKYRGSEGTRVFEQNFGPPPHCDVCAIGMEPNPRHAARLRRLERQLTRAQAPVAILLAAAATADGQARFVIPAVFDGAHEDWGARSPVQHGQLPPGHITSPRP